MGISRRQAGFTLIELMVALAVAAIVLSFAIPSFEAIINANRLSSGANEVVASMQTARMESLRRNVRAVVCLSATPNAAAPTCSTTNPVGWITFLDADKSGDFNGTDTLLRASLIKTPVRVASNLTNGKLTFLSDGLARAGGGATVTSASDLLNGTVDVCIVTTRPTQNVRHVNIAHGSSVSVASATSAACAAPGAYIP